MKLKFLLIIFCGLLFSGHILAQDGDGESEEEVKRRILEHYGSGDEKLEEELDDTLKTLQDPSSAEAEKPAEAGAEDPEKAKKEEPIESSFISGMMNDVTKKMIAEYLKKNPLSEMPKDQVEEIFMGQFGKTAFGQMIKKNENLKEAFVEWLRHPKALPKLLSIVNEPGKVKKYGVIVFVVFLVAFALNLVNSSGSLLRRIGQKILITLGSLFVNFFSGYYIFSEQLKPTIDIIMDKLL